MLTRDLLAFVRASLPTPPARVLEVGAGGGELAAVLTEAGYEVTAVDPAAPSEKGPRAVGVVNTSDWSAPRHVSPATGLMDLR